RRAPAWRQRTPSSAVIWSGRARPRRAGAEDRRLRACRSRGSCEGQPRARAQRRGIVRRVDARRSRAVVVPRGDLRRLGDPPGDHVAVIRQLLAAGAKHVANRHGETAHDIAIAFGSAAAAALLAREFRTAPLAAGKGLTAADVTRLLARLAKHRHSIVGVSGDPDPAIEKLLRAGKVAKRSLVVTLDARQIPKLSPTVRRELLNALAQE